MARAAAPKFSAFWGRCSTTLTFSQSIEPAPYNIAAMISDANLRAQLPHTLRQLDLPGSASSTAGRSATTTRAAIGS